MLSFPLYKVSHEVQVLCKSTCYGSTVLFISYVQGYSSLFAKYARHRLLWL